jgi:hypothetical protein
LVDDSTVITDLFCFSESIPTFTVGVNRVSVRAFLPVHQIWTPNRPHTGTIGQSRDSIVGSKQASPASDGRLMPVNRDSRIPHGIGITGAWYSAHIIGVQTRGSQTSRLTAVGSRAVYGAEDVTWWFRHIG